MIASPPSKSLAPDVLPRDPIADSHTPCLIGSGSCTGRDAQRPRTGNSSHGVGAIQASRGVCAKNRDLHSRSHFVIGSGGNLRRAAADHDRSQRPVADSPCRQGERVGEQHVTENVLASPIEVRRQRWYSRNSILDLQKVVLPFHCRVAGVWTKLA